MRRSKYFIPILMFLALLLPVGCRDTDTVGTTAEQGRWIDVYYVASDLTGDGPIIDAESREIPFGTLTQTIRAIFEESKKTPVRASLRSAVPEAAQLNQVRVENGTATLDISKPYSDQGSLARTLADYCLVSSLCSLEGIRDVTILVNGVPPYNRDSQNLSPEKLVTEEVKLLRLEKNLKLYFANADYSGLALEVRNTVARENESEPELVVRGLLDGPAQHNLRGTMPEGVQLLSATVEGDCCYVDLSGEFIKNHDSDQARERLTLYSLVNSLCEVPGVGRVQILIDGVRTKGFVHYDLSVAYTRALP